MKETMFHKVLFPTDFSAVSRKALEYVKELKELGTEEIILLHIMRIKYYYLSEDSFPKDLEGPVEELKKEARKKMITVGTELQKRGFKVKAIIAEGLPSSKIMEVAQKEKVSSIILGSRGKGILRKIFFGSVAEAVVRGSKFPVVVIKDDSHLKEEVRELPGTEDRMTWRIFHRFKFHGQAGV